MWGTVSDEGGGGEVMKRGIKFQKGRGVTFKQRVIWGERQLVVPRQYCSPPSLPPVPPSSRSNTASILPLNPLNPPPPHPPPPPHHLPPLPPFQLSPLPPLPPPHTHLAYSSSSSVRASPAAPVRGEWNVNRHLAKSSSSTPNLACRREGQSVKCSVGGVGSL